MSIWLTLYVKHNIQYVMDIELINVQNMGCDSDSMVRNGIARKANFCVDAIFLTFFQKFK